MLSKKYEGMVFHQVWDTLKIPLFSISFKVQDVVHAKVYKTVSIRLRLEINNKMYITVARSNSHFDPANIETVKELIS